MKLGTWLAAMMQPLVARILASLGFSVVSIVGVQAALDGLVAQFKSSLMAMPADAIQLFLLAGGGEGLGIVFGAMAVKVMLWQIQSSTRILGVAA
jgi:hypothetical protein